MVEVQERVRVYEATSRNISSQGTTSTAVATALHPVAQNTTASPAQTVTPASYIKGSPLHWSAPSPVAGCFALQNAEELAQAWATHQGDVAELPKVDFENAMVLAVFSGEGFFREVPSIERIKVLADEVVVYVCRFSRPWSKRNAQAVVQVPVTGRPVRFVHLS